MSTSNKNTPFDNEESLKDLTLEDLPPLETCWLAHFKISASERLWPPLPKSAKVLTILRLINCQTNPNVNNLLPSTMSDPSIPTSENPLALPISTP